MRQPQRGFTLVELMVVVAIIAILTALVVGLSGRTYGVNATTLSEQFAQTFSYARQRALSTRKIHRVSIHFDLDPMEIRIWQARETGMSRTSINETTAGLEPLFVERTILPKSVSVFSAVIGANAAGAITPTATTTRFDIDFLPNGGADVSGGATSSDPATIYITDNSGSRATRVLVYSVTGSSYARANW